MKSFTYKDGLIGMISCGQSVPYVAFTTIIVITKINHRRPYEHGQRKGGTARL